MKRLILILTVFLTVFTVSCADGEYINPVFPCALTVRTAQSGAEFRAEISDSECKIELTGGEMAGTMLVFSGEGGKATAGGFTREIQPELFPTQYTFYRAMRAIAETRGEKAEEANVLKYSLDETEILVYYGQESRKLERVETNEGGRRFVFSVGSDS